MLCEFTGTDDLPIVVHYDQVAAVVQKKKWTYVYLNSGVSFKVIESAAEVLADISNAATEALLASAALMPQTIVQG